VYFEPLEDLGFDLDFDFEELVVGFFDELLLATVFGFVLLVDEAAGFDSAPPKAYGLAGGSGGGASAVTGGVW
jgi:hypothetical protein